MKFIQIKEILHKSSYDAILELDSGPDFVFSRSSYFKHMIKEQGLTFWFRFWLTFCFTPGCNDLKGIQDQWPLRTTFTNIYIHDNFLQGSIEDAANYSLTTAIKSLTIVKQLDNDLNETNAEEKSDEPKSDSKSSSDRKKSSVIQLSKHSSNSKMKLKTRPTTKKVACLSTPKLRVNLTKNSTEVKNSLGIKIKSPKIRYQLKENGNPISKINKNSNSNKTRNNSKNNDAKYKANSIGSKKYGMQLEKPVKNDPPPHNFRLLLQEYTEMAFGAALCVIFYKWLLARDSNNKDMCYWKIPNDYLNLKFKPGALENHLFKCWDSKLLYLLGTSQKQLPWLANLVISKPQPPLIESFDRSIFPELTEYSAEILSKLIIEKRKQIQKFSCKDDVNSLSDAFLQISMNDEGRDEIDKKVSDGQSRCFYCKNVLTVTKKCRECLAEAWNEPREYCSDFCRLEHWFTEHRKEHNINGVLKE